MTKHKILVVDDDPAIAREVRRYLGNDKYEVVDAPDGERGLIYAIKKRPDLVVLDVEMPKMRGWEVCKLLKHNKYTEKIPVLILTSRSDLSDIMIAMQQGADDYLSKPFTKDELILRIERLLSSE